MAKKSFYEKLEDIPEADRADYELINGKYVLQLDGVHPVQVKNTELLAEKSQRDAPLQTLIAQKDTEIQRLAGEVAVAKQTSLPANHVAIPVDKFQALQEIESLGDLKTVKEKVAEHPTLKAKEEERAQSERFAEIAKDEGMDATAFAKLARDEKLLDRIEARKIDDGKGNKLTHYFVKPAEGGSGDAVALKDHVKESETFKPFLNSLYLSDEQKKKIKIPDNKTGEVVSDKSVSESYLGSTYKRPDKQDAAAAS